jgi:hypothetical protein
MRSADPLSTARGIAFGCCVSLAFSLFGLGAVIAATGSEDFGAYLVLGAAGASVLATLIGYHALED